VVGHPVAVPVRRRAVKVPRCASQAEQDQRREELTFKLGDERLGQPGSDKVTPRVTVVIEGPDDEIVTGSRLGI
jgi:hypothetical protein